MNMFSKGDKDEKFLLEVEISSGSSAPAPEIKKRLEMSGKKEPLTRTSIEERLAKASSRRENMLANIEKSMMEQDKKIELIKERKSSLERAVEEESKAKMNIRDNVARVNRQSIMQNRRSKAKTHNERVQEKVRSITSSKVLTTEEMRGRMMDKLNDAAERRQ